MAGQESLPLRRLKQFQPLNRLTDDQLVLLASRAERRTHGPGQRVVERGVRWWSVVCMLRGVCGSAPPQKRAHITCGGAWCTCAEP